MSDFDNNLICDLCQHLPAKRYNHAVPNEITLCEFCATTFAGNYLRNPGSGREPMPAAGLAALIAQLYWKLKA